MVALIVSALFVLFGIALFAGGPSTPATLQSINDSFQSVDFSDLPEISTFSADDGEALAYRSYKPVGTLVGSVTLIHGSSANSQSMHPLAKSLANAGYEVFSLDMRGHGISGTKGHIAYIGQLEQDLVSFVRAVKPRQRSTLVGFSAGGGFVLRFAGSEHQALFSSYLLLSPFITHDAPNYRADAKNWVNVGIPRTIAISALNSIGINAFNHLPVLRFALSKESSAHLTPYYDFNLAMNFRADADFRANIQKVEMPCAAIAGDKDELFDSEALAPLFKSEGRSWPAQVLPDIGHIAITLEPSAHKAIEQQVRKLQAQ